MVLSAVSFRDHPHLDLSNFQTRPWTQPGEHPIKDYDRHCLPCTMPPKGSRCHYPVHGRTNKNKGREKRNSLFELGDLSGFCALRLRYVLPVCWFLGLPAKTDLNRLEHGSSLELICIQAMGRFTSHNEESMLYHKSFHV